MSSKENNSGLSIRGRLMNKAVITTPLIALYGAAPAFLFTSLDIWSMIVSFLALSGGLFVLWILNVYLVQHKNIISRYLLSYSLPLIVITAFSILGRDLSGQQFGHVQFIYLFIATLAVNSIIIILIDSEILKKRKDMAESEVQQLRVSNLEAQKRALMQQLHPHFLFNALSVLKSLITQKPDVASDYTLRLSEFLRYSVKHQNDDLVRVSEELQFTSDYIELQKMRFGKALSFRIDIPDEVQEKKLPVFAMQSLVENAIKHNRFSVSKPLSVVIELRGKGIAVSNNRTPKPLVLKSGTGLKNLQERYKLHADKGIEILKESFEFTVILSLIE